MEFSNYELKFLLDLLKDYKKRMSVVTKDYKNEKDLYEILIEKIQTHFVAEKSKS